MNAARFNLAVSPRLRTTPFHDRVVAAGAQALSVYNHMLVPLVYESWEADYPHLLERVQLWDVTVERQVESRGRDALALVELMTPRDIARCAVGQCMYAPLVDEHGGIVSDPLILRLAGDRFWVSIADSDVLLWAKGLAAGKGFDADVREPDVSPLALQGPLADEVAEADSVPGFAYLGLTCMRLVHPPAKRYAVAAEINSTYAGVGPFWGRPAAWHCPGVPTRASDRTCRRSHPAEKRVADEHATGAKTVWQLFYNGSVGSQALLGMPTLDRLRKTPGLSGNTAVWPFDGGLSVPDAPVVLAEVYPSLLREAIVECAGENEILDRAQVRVNAEAFASLDARGMLVPLFGGSPALTASERRVVEAEEAWILGLGHEKALLGSSDRA